MTKREERERRRAERLAAEQREASGERRRLILGYVVAGVLGAAVIGGIAIAIAGGGGDGNEADPSDFPEAAHIEVNSGFVHGFEADGREGTPPPPIGQGDLEAAATAAGCELQLELEDEGNTHIEDAADAPEYKTDPPTSGDHFAEQQADGAYAEFVDPVYWVHSLEHGRIVIQYSPDLPEEQQLELKGVFDEDPNGMLLFENPEMESEVAASAWTQLLACPAYEGEATLDAIRDFRDIFRGNGPEAVPTHIAG